MKKILIVLLVFAVAVPFAQKTTGKVKSKRGDINLAIASGGGSTVCTAGFNDEMSIIKREDTWTLVKASCGQGWVKNDVIEQVLQGPSDKIINVEAVKVNGGWIDIPSTPLIFSDATNSFEGVIKIDRNFKDYLKNTADREQTERLNNEN